NLHERLSGPATKHILERQYNIFNDKRFERLKNISSSHIYNLRASKIYQLHSMTMDLKGYNKFQISTFVRLMDIPPMAGQHPA
ncbi:MAG: hypothetical protein L6420_05185, partial [Elusimicrobia bacterium]|nr:hypothetical protein [Elusimicrobiota bacterium]